MDQSSRGRGAVAFSGRWAANKSPKACMQGRAAAHACTNLWVAAREHTELWGIAPPRHARSAAAAACPAAAGPAAAGVQAGCTALHGSSCCWQWCFVQYAGLEDILQQPCGVGLVNVEAFAARGGPAVTEQQGSGGGRLEDTPERLLPSVGPSCKAEARPCPGARRRCRRLAGWLAGKAWETLSARRQAAQHASLHAADVRQMAAANNSQRGPPHLAPPRRAESPGLGRSHRCVAGDGTRARGIMSRNCRPSLARDMQARAPREHSACIPAPKTGRLIRPQAACIPCIGARCSATAAPRSDKEGAPVTCATSSCASPSTETVGSRTRDAPSAHLGEQHQQRGAECDDAHDEPQPAPIAVCRRPLPGIVARPGCRCRQAGHPAAATSASARQQGQQAPPRLRGWATASAAAILFGPVAALPGIRAICLQQGSGDHACREHGPGHGSSVAQAAGKRRQPCTAGRMSSGHHTSPSRVHDAAHFMHSKRPAAPTAAACCTAGRRAGRVQAPCLPAAPHRWAAWQRRGAPRPAP